MFEVNTDCPYLCTDCFELGCAYCDIEEQLEGRYNSDDDFDDSDNSDNSDNSECECDFDLEDDDEDEREDFFVDEDCPNFSEPCLILGCNNCSYHD